MAMTMAMAMAMAMAVDNPLDKGWNKQTTPPKHMNATNTPKQPANFKITQVEMLCHYNYYT